MGESRTGRPAGWSWLAICVLSGLLAACGGEGSTSTPAPEGSSERTEDSPIGEVSIAYPDDWGELEQSTDRSATVYEAQSPDGDARVEMRVLEDTGNSFEAISQGAASLAAANAGFALKIDSDEEIDVDGASDAKLYTYGPSDTVEQADTAVGEAFTAVAEAEDGGFVIVGVAAQPDSGFDPEPIAESLRIGG